MSFEKYIRDLQPGILPSGRIHHLVNAACGINPEVSWRSYIDAIGDDELNEGEKRLYPLIGSKLDIRSSGGPIADIVDGIDQWAKARAIVSNRTMRDVGALFKSHDIPLIWTKGVALAELAYPAPHLRPSSDVDGIMRWEDRHRIEALAESEGWATKLGKNFDRPNGRYINTELSFDVNKMCALDLAWMPRRAFAFDPFMSNQIWARAEDKKHTSEFPMVDETWLLIEAMEHGLYANEVYPIRWIVDSVLLIEKFHDTIQWDLLLEVGERYELMHLFQVGILTIANYTDNVPADILSVFTQFQPTGLDRDELSSRLSNINLTKAFHSNGRYNLLRRSNDYQYAVLRGRVPLKDRNMTLRSRIAITKRDFKADISAAFSKRE